MPADGPPDRIADLLGRLPKATLLGILANRARGRKGGRRKKLGAQQRALAVELYRQKKHSIDEICRTVGISKPTPYAYVRGAQAEGSISR